MPYLSWMYLSFCHDLQLNYQSTLSRRSWMYLSFCHDLQRRTRRSSPWCSWMYLSFCHDLQHNLRIVLMDNIESTSRVHYMPQAKGNQLPHRINPIHFLLYFYFLQYFLRHCNLHVYLLHSESILN